MNIQPQDLRIGNWVKVLIADNEDNPQVIYDVLCDSVNTATHQGVTYDLIEPVPLSEPILLKCGFEKTTEVIFELGNCLLYLGIGFVDFYYFGNQIKQNVKYLHDLQNGYKWHSSTELEITL